MTRRRRLWPAAALLVAAGAASAATAQEVEEQPSSFPQGPHRDEVFAFCTACHSGRIVGNQAMSRERWDETLTWMTARHGMPPLEGAERQRFLDYLAQAFGEAGGGAAAPVARRPFATQPNRRNPFAPE